MIKLKNGIILIEKNISTIKPFVEYIEPLKGFPVSPFRNDTLRYDVGVKITMVEGSNYKISSIRDFESGCVEFEKMEVDAEAYAVSICNLIFPDLKVRNIGIKNLNIDE